MMNYAKMFAQVVATVLAALVASQTGGGVTDVEWIQIATVGVGAAMVFAGPNVPGALFTKSVLSVLAAVLVVLTSAIVGGISQADIYMMVIAGLGALGVYAVPNTGTTTGGG
jgi:hypothetical protein